MQIKSKTQILSAVLSVLVSVGLVATAANAALTLDALTIDSDGALNLGTTNATSVVIGSATALTSFAGKLTGQLYINDTGATAITLKIHSHSMAADVDTANEFKSDSVATTGGMVGLYSEALRDVSGTASMTGIMGIGYGGPLGVVSTGGNVIGVSGGADISGTVNGAGITIAGVVGGIMPMSGTLTLVKDMTALWGSSNALKVPVTGDSELLLLSTGTGTTLGQAIKIDGYDALDRITNFVKFSNVTAGMVSITESLDDSNDDDILSDGYIKILVDGGTYYIPIYDSIAP